MSEIKFKVSQDGNEKTYIPLIKKRIDRSLSEIKECLSNNDYVDICSLENILESHFDTESYLQETDGRFI
jgi:hypothetical protein